MHKNVSRNLAQRFARARYLDTAIKHFDLSFGPKEALELKNSGDEANILKPGEAITNRFDPVTFWDHPITGPEAYVLLGQAQFVQARRLGVRPRLPYVNIPRFGKSVVRLMLWRESRPDPSDWLIEVENLDDVQSHFLVSLDPRVPHITSGWGWLSSAEIRKAKKVRLVEGGPEVYTIPFEQLHQGEN
jgi:hypothetical protein